MMNEMAADDYRVCLFELYSVSEFEYTVSELYSAWQSDWNQISRKMFVGLQYDISNVVGVAINLANIGANGSPPTKLITVPLANSHMFIQQAIRSSNGYGVDGIGIAFNFTLTTMSTVSGFGLGMEGKTGATLSTGHDATLWGVNELSNSVRNSPPKKH